MTFDLQQFKKDYAKTILIVDSYKFPTDNSTLPFLTSYEKEVFELALLAYNELYDAICRAVVFPSIGKRLEILNSIFGSTVIPCYEGYYPHTFLIDGPDGGRLLNHYLTRINEFEYDYSTGKFKNVAGREFLFGNKNILDHSTDPLRYLDFLKLKHEKRDEDTCYLGIELEVERKEDTPKDIMFSVMKDLGKHYAILKKDGSLQNGGFEIVTAPATYGVHLTAWDKFFANSAKYLDSYNNGHCGIHVHISRRAFTPLHLAKMTSFYNYDHNLNFITKVAGRTSTFAQFKNKDMLDKLRGKSATKLKGMKGLLNNIYGHSGGRQKYEAVNLCKPDTVEIRIFRGNVAKLGFFKNIDFVQAVFDYTKIASCMNFDVGTENSLHYEAFLRWLKEQPKYNSLKLWLSKHGYLELKEKKVNEKFKINEEEVKRCA